ncbi:ABC transporter ATP-binding protein [Pseudochelatococcus sp. B33]
MASVTIDKVYKAYGNLEVIHGASIDIADGEFVVLVGPSGCGKSTLLRAIAGLESISGGDIRIGAKVVNDLAAKNRDIAMVFQNYALYPHMTVAENMGFSLRIKKTPKDEKNKRVNRAAEILGLTQYLARYPRELSGGQRQRVAMGRAIVRDPQVFLFDEPLSNLDAKLRVQMRAEIKELHHRLKTTTIYVTHDQIEAMTMADKIVVMNSGNVEQIGAPLELYDRPRNLFVASFIGSPAMNLIKGRIEDNGGAPSFLTENGDSLPVGVRVGANARPAILGVRPEHLQVVPADTPGAFEAEVVVVEPTGAETVVLARTGSKQITAAFRERHSFRAGDRIRLHADPANTHLFDGVDKGGERLA